MSAEDKPDPCRVCGRKIDPAKESYTIITSAGSRTYECQVCRDEATISEWTATKRLTRKLMSDATMAAFIWRLEDRSQWREPRMPPAIAFEVDAAVNRVSALVKTWAATKWRTVQPIVKACRTHGMSGENSVVKVLAMAMAGRVVFTISAPSVPDTDITIIGAEDEGPERFGIQSIDGTEDAVRKLLDLAIGAWPALRSDTGVGL